MQLGDASHLVLIVRFAEVARVLLVCGIIQLLKTVALDAVFEFLLAANRAQLLRIRLQLLLLRATCVAKELFGVRIAGSEEGSLVCLRLLLLTECRACSLV